MPVAVISEYTASKLFGTSDAVGREIVMLRSPIRGEPAPEAITRTVIGVSNDTDAGAVGRRAQGVMFVPFGQHYEPRMTIVARTAGDPAPLVGQLQAAIGKIDPEMAVIDAGTGPVLGGATSMMLGVTAGLAGLLGTLALVLSMVGLYGVLAHLVARRTREVGIRLALGADAPRIMWMILRDGVRPVAWGIVAGLAFGALARMGLRPIFVRLMPAFDVSVLFIVPALFLIAAVVACYVPARRAARVDPNVALRHL